MIDPTGSFLCCLLKKHKRACRAGQSGRAFGNDSAPHRPDDSGGYKLLPETSLAFRLWVHGEDELPSRGIHSVYRIQSAAYSLLGGWEEKRSRHGHGAGSNNEALNDRHPIAVIGGMEWALEAGFVAVA